MNFVDNMTPEAQILYLFVATLSYLFVFYWLLKDYRNGIRFHISIYHYIIVGLFVIVNLIVLFTFGFAGYTLPFFLVPSQVLLVAIARISIVYIAFYIATLFVIPRAIIGFLAPISLFGIFLTTFSLDIYQGFDVSYIMIVVPILLMISILRSEEFNPYYSKKQIQIGYISASIIGNIGLIITYFIYQSKDIFMVFPLSKSLTLSSIDHRLTIFIVVILLFNVFQFLLYLGFHLNSKRVPRYTKLVFSTLLVLLTTLFVLNFHFMYNGVRPVSASESRRFIYVPSGSYNGKVEVFYGQFDGEYYVYMYPAVELEPRGRVKDKITSTQITFEILETDDGGYYFPIDISGTYSYYVNFYNEDRDTVLFLWFGSRNFTRDGFLESPYIIYLKP